MADPNAKCPTCGSDKFTYQPGGERWWCGQCRVSFEVGKNPTPAPVTIEGTVDSGVGGLASTRPALPSTAGGGTRPATRTLSPADVPARDRLDALVETVREGIDSDSGDYTTQDIGHAALDDLAGIARQGADRFVWQPEDGPLVRENTNDPAWEPPYRTQDEWRAERDRLKAALRETIRAYEAINEGTRIDAKMGYPLPGDSATYVALALHADETFTRARAALADVGGTEETEASRGH